MSNTNNSDNTNTYQASQMPNTWDEPMDEPMAEPDDDESNDDIDDDDDYSHPFDDDDTESEPDANDEDNWDLENDSQGRWSGELMYGHKHKMSEFEAEFFGEDRDYDAMNYYYGDNNE